MTRRGKKDQTSVSDDDMNMREDGDATDDLLAVDDDELTDEDWDALVQFALDEDVDEELELDPGADAAGLEDLDEPAEDSAGAAAETEGVVEEAEGSFDESAWVREVDAFLDDDEDDDDAECVRPLSTALAGTVLQGQLLFELSGQGKLSPEEVLEELRLFLRVWVSRFADLDTLGALEPSEREELLNAFLDELQEQADPDREIDRDEVLAIVEAAAG